MKTLPADLEALMPEPGQYAVADQAGPRWYFRGCILWPTKQQADDAARTDLGSRDSIPLFTADQMREAIRGATERAAKLCEQQAVDAPFIEGYYSAMECAAAIRSGGEAGEPI